MMRGHSGKEGLVPVNYIDKLDTAQEQKATDLLDDGQTAPQANGGIDDSGVSYLYVKILFSWEHRDFPPR
jgi:hypothetical protein